MAVEHNIQDTAAYANAVSDLRHHLALACHYAAALKDADRDPLVDALGEDIFATLRDLDFIRSTPRSRQAVRDGCAAAA